MINISRDPAGTGGVGTPEVTDLERRAADTVKTGRVIAIDYANPNSPRVRVGIGDSEDPEGYITTGWLPMATGRSNEWNPLKVGEVVQVHSESGELQNGVVGHSIHSEDNPAPGDRADLWRKRFADGSVVEYDEAAGVMRLTGKERFEAEVGEASIRMDGDSIVLTAGGATFIVGNGKVSGTGGLHIEGGTVTHNSKNIGDTHIHLNSGGPSPGGPPA